MSAAPKPKGSAEAAKKPASAVSISRLLKARGLTRSEENRSGMVRGWVTTTRGFRVEAVMETGHRRVRHGAYADGSPRYVYRSDNRPTGVVEVTWQVGETGRSMDFDQAAAKMQDGLDSVTAILLEQGYRIERLTRGEAKVPYLLVSRRDAQDNIIVG